MINHILSWKFVSIIKNDGNFIWILKYVDRFKIRLRVRCLQLESADHPSSVISRVRYLYIREVRGVVE